MAADDSRPKHDRPEAQPDHPPRISVITANYNYADFIGRTIESIACQTYADIEHIVVDDGSTDDSVTVIERYPHVRLIRKANGGQVSAMIEGVAAATGDLILFVDSDDTLYPDACERAAAAYVPGVPLYQFGLDIVDTDGRRIGRYPDRALLARGQAEAALRHGDFPSSPTSGNAFSTDHVRRMFAVIGDDRRYFIDGYLIYSAPFFGPIRTSDAIIGTYLVHGRNVSLSAGVNRRSAEKSLRNALWQRSGIVNAVRLTGGDAGEPADHLTAWHYRYMLILRKCYGVRDIAPHLSDRAVAFRAMRRFVSEPLASLRQKAQNIVLIATLLLGEKRLGRKIVADR